MSHQTKRNPNDYYSVDTDRVNSMSDEAIFLAMDALFDSELARYIMDRGYEITNRKLD